MGRVVVAALAIDLVKIRQQANAPAVGGLGQAQQRIELAAHHLLESVARRALVDHAALADHVAVAIGHPGIGGQAVAPAPAGFLVVALDVLGHVHMGDKAHIGLVDAHAECDGGDHHNAFFAQKAALVLLAQFGTQAGVVGQGVDAGIAQRLRDLFHLLARQAIDDARIAIVLALDKAQQLGGGVFFLDDGVADVGAVKAADEDARRFELHALDDVGAGQRIGRGGERNARHTGIALVQHGQLAVLRPKVVPPLADAMRLVDGEQGQLAHRMQLIEQAQKTRRVEPLGRHIQQGDAARQQLQLHIAGLVVVEGGVEEGGLDTDLVHGADLVVHQRDEGRDDDGGAVALLLAHDGRDLVAQAFAAAGGHQHQRIAAANHMVNNGLLRAAKMRIAKGILQNGVGEGSHKLLEKAAVPAP